MKNISELDGYPWSSHGALMGRFKNGWQDREYVLRWLWVKELKAGCRRRHILMVRAKITFQLIEDYGMSMAEVDEL